jgi:hypothetical protein
MIKRYGEINDVIFRNQGYCPYNMATKYKLSYEGEVYFVYVDSYKELKEKIMQLTGGGNEQGNEEEEKF